MLSTDTKGFFYKTCIVLGVLLFSVAIIDSIDADNVLSGRLIRARNCTSAQSCAAALDILQHSLESHDMTTGYSSIILTNEAKDAAVFYADITSLRTQAIEAVSYDTDSDEYEQRMDRITDNLRGRYYDFGSHRFFHSTYLYVSMILFVLGLVFFTLKF